MDWLRECAQAGGGKAYFIDDYASDLKTKVIEALSRAFKPSLSEL